MAFPPFERFLTSPLVARLLRVLTTGEAATVLDVPTSAELDAVQAAAQLNTVAGRPLSANDAVLLTDYGKVVSLNSFELSTDEITPVIAEGRQIVVLGPGTVVTANRATVTLEATESATLVGNAAGALVLTALAPLRRSIRTAAATAPSNPLTGDEWFNTIDGQSYSYTGTAWVTQAESTSFTGYVFGYGGRLAGGTAATEVATPATLVKRGSEGQAAFAGISTNAVSGTFTYSGAADGLAGVKGTSNALLSSGLLGTHTGASTGWGVIGSSNVSEGGVKGVAGTGTGVLGISTSGSGGQFTGGGDYHAEFGTVNTNHRLVVESNLGGLSWFRQVTGNPVKSTLTPGSITAARTWTLPNLTGTISLDGQHSHVSADITDASLGSGGTANAGLLAKFDSGGGLTASSLNTAEPPDGFNSTLNSTGLQFYRGVHNLEITTEDITGERAQAFADADGTLALTASTTGVPDHLHDGTIDGTLLLSPTSLTVGTGADALMRDGIKAEREFMINALDYGVVADFDYTDGASGTNNAPFLQDAIDAAYSLYENSNTPTIVQLPPGHIRFNTELTIKNNVIIRGHGPARTYLWARTPGQNGMVLDQTSNYSSASYGKLQGFALYGPGALPPTVADSTDYWETGDDGDGLETGVGLLLDRKEYVGDMVFGPFDVEDVAVVRWRTCVRISQIPMFYARHLYVWAFADYGWRISGTDTFHFDASGGGWALPLELSPVMFPQAADGEQTLILMEQPDPHSAGPDTSSTFTGQFTNCEFAIPKRMLVNNFGGVVTFESCNFEGRTDADGSHSTGQNNPYSENSAFRLIGTSQLTLRDCRVACSGVMRAGMTALESAIAAVIIAESNDSNGFPVISIENTSLIANPAMPGGLGYPVGISVVGTETVGGWGYAQTGIRVAGLPNSIRWWRGPKSGGTTENPATVVHTLMGYHPNYMGGGKVYSSQLLSYVDYSSPTAINNWCATNLGTNIRTVNNLYFATDSAPADDNEFIVRTTRKIKQGSAVLRRTSMVPELYAERLANSTGDLTIAASTNGAWFLLAGGYIEFPTVYPNHSIAGTLNSTMAGDVVVPKWTLRAGDTMTLKASGTHAAATTNSTRLWQPTVCMLNTNGSVLASPDIIPGADWLSVASASEVLWEAQVVFYAYSNTSVTGYFQIQTWNAAGELVKNYRMAIPAATVNFGYDSIPGLRVSLNSSFTNDTVCKKWELAWQSGYHAWW